MYERFYHLRDRPFALSPDPDYLYPSRVHREALDYLRFGIDGYAGFIVITGEIGSGKTTLLQVLLRNLDGQTTVIRLVNTLLTGRELLESMLLDLDVNQVPPTKPGMLRELARRLIDQRARGRRVVAVIDEAQNLSLEALEELRMLSNLETEKSKLIQIVLVGQPDLRDKLALPTLEQLRQRVTVRYHIDPLDAQETANYINHRLRRAALGAPLQFPRDVTDTIHARSGGVPRLINVISDAVLLFGYADERRIIDVQLVRDAFEELEASSVLRPVKPPQGPPQSSTPPPSPPPAQPPPQPVSYSTASAVKPPSSMPGPAPAIRPATPPPPAASPGYKPLYRAPDPVQPRPSAWEQRRAESLSASVQVAARGSLRTSPAVAAPAPLPEARPYIAPFRPGPAKPAGAWSWMKEVFFGVTTERG